MLSVGDCRLSSGATVLVSVLEWLKRTGARRADSAPRSTLRCGLPPPSGRRRRSSRTSTRPSLKRSPNPTTSGGWRRRSTPSCASLHADARLEDVLRHAWLGHATARSASSCSLRASSRCAIARLASIRSRTWTTATCGRLVRDPQDRPRRREEDHRPCQKGRFLEVDRSGDLELSLTTATAGRSRSTICSRERRAQNSALSSRIRQYARLMPSADEIRETQRSAWAGLAAAGRSGTRSSWSSSPR